MTNNNNETQLTTAELIQKSQDGSLKPGAYTWKKLVTPPDDADNNYPAPNPVPVEPTNPVENNDENKDKDENNNKDSSDVNPKTWKVYLLIVEDLFLCFIG